MIIVNHHFYAQHFKLWSTGRFCIHTWKKIGHTIADVHVVTSHTHAVCNKRDTMSYSGMFSGVRLSMCTSQMFSSLRVLYGLLDLFINRSSLYH